MWTNNSTNTGLSADPENGGSGFQSWTSQEEYSGGVNTNCGFFISTPTFNNPFPPPSTYTFPELSAGENTCFGIYAHTNTRAYARRKMRMPLSVGGFITVSLGISYRNGKKGVRFIDNTSVPPVTTFAFYASDSEGGYRLYTQEHGARDPGIGYTINSTFDITIYNTPFASFKGYFLATKVNDTDNDAVFLSDPIKVDEIEFFVENTDDSLETNNLYFNILTGYSAYR